MELTKQITLRVSAESFAAIRRLAAKEQRKIADVVRRLLEKAMRSQS